MLGDIMLLLGCDLFSSIRCTICYQCSILGLAYDIVCIIPV